MVIRIRTCDGRVRDRNLGPGHGVLHNYERERREAEEYLTRPPRYTCVLRQLAQQGERPA